LLPRRLLLAAVSAVTLAAGAATSVTAASAAPPTPESAHGPSELAPKHVFPVRSAKVGGQARPTRSTSTGISYHGGPIIANPKTVAIFYGGSAMRSSFKSVVTGFLSNLGGSPYFNINTTYNNGGSTYVQNNVGQLAGTFDVAASSMVGVVNDPYNLSDADVQKVVFNLISGNVVPWDASNIYLLIGSDDVNLTSGFGTQYCGWHTHGWLDSARDVKYAAMIDPTLVMSACADQTTSLTGDAGADALVSVAAHEIEEAATDPQLNAWYDNRGYENADKCAWNFGTTSTASTGAKYNMTLANTQYLIQQNWVNYGSGGCRLVW
jgi:hypothetical protein